jgi:hypothetical protein
MGVLFPGFIPIHISVSCAECSERCLGFAHNWMLAFIKESTIIYMQSFLNSLSFVLLFDDNFGVVLEFLPYFIQAP